MLNFHMLVVRFLNLDGNIVPFIYVKLDWLFLRLNADVQEPLHLYLSGNNPKSLEDARILAENLLDTICLECGVSR